MVYLQVIEFEFKANPNYSLCLVYVWVMTHFRVVLGVIHGWFLKEDGIEEEYGRKESEKGKICHFWVVSATSTDTRTGWYRYHLYRGQMVPVPTKVVPYHSPKHEWYWYQSVPVPIGTSAVPLFPTALISCILTFLSPNSYTKSIGTLVND